MSEENNIVEKTNEEKDIERKQKVINNIKENYKQIENSIVKQLFMKQDLHPGTTGGAREDVWEELFKMIIPKKFVLEHSVFIIDSGDGVSREVDLAIIDEMYTPYIFRYGRLKFVPIEAVAAVVECKSTIFEEEALKEWSGAIQRLKTKPYSITRIATRIATEAHITQKSTRPIRILCTLKRPRFKWEEMFDFLLVAIDGKENNSHIDIKIKDSFNSLYESFKELNFYNMTEKEESDWKCDIEKLKASFDGKPGLNEYEIKDLNDKSISLLSFNFQFNQLLMLINNPMPFPHKEYVDMFNRKEESKK